MVYNSQNFEKRKQSLVKDSTPNVIKKDFPEEPVETTNGKIIQGCAYHYCLILLKSYIIVKFIF